MDEEPVKKKRGRPAGSKNEKTPLVTRRRQYNYSLMERIRERIDPDIMIDYHIAILEGKHPKLEKDGDSWIVVPDPSPLAQSPSLEQKTASIKFLTERGYGLPVQSTQVDIEIRARIDALGSGITTQELMGYDPEALKLMQAAFSKAKALPAPQDNIEDAEFVDISASASANNVDVNANSPPLEETSNTSSSNSEQ